jgi:hypothetical protein
LERWHLLERRTQKVKGSQGFRLRVSMHPSAQHPTQNETVDVVSVFIVLVLADPAIVLL